MERDWRKTLNHWAHGIRFYIGITIGLLSLEVWWWAAVSYSGSSLFAIRLEEAYAWFAVGFLSTALLIGPLFGSFRNLPGRGVAYDARRWLGIGAAWFTTLHVSVAYLALFKLANPLHVPGHYRIAFLVGGGAWLILLAMAFTSFDTAFRRMGVWWFRLHRFVYLAAALTLLHAFTIGAQASRPIALNVLGLTASLLLGLHCYAIIRKGKRVSNWQLLTIASMTAALVVIFSFGYRQRNQYQTTAVKGEDAYAQIH